MSKKSYTLTELAKLLNAQIRGDADYQISGIAPLDRAQANQISFLSNSQFRSHLINTNAGAVIVTADEATHCPSNALIMKDPYLGYAKVATLFVTAPMHQPGIHATAAVGENSQIHPSVHIAAHCVIGNNVSIGENSVIKAGCVIADNCVIGKQTRLEANVTLYHDIQIGERVIIHSGVIVGSDGFGMANDNGVWQKIPQLGTVIIGNDVEIGANTTIDRGALNNTVIENGVKLDNLIQIAHNVTIGAHTAIAACTAIAGSATIGKHCMIGGGSSIVGHIEIADQVILVGTSVVEKSIKEAGIYGSGTGLLPFRELKRNVVRFRQLDDIVRRLQKLEKVQNEFNGNE